jgi:lipoprotein-anchoring transpeptidase ErfK/SrfK
VQQSQWPVTGRSVFFRNREGILAAAAGAALLAGLTTSAGAVPFNQQPQAQPQPAKPGVVTAARDKAPAKEDDVAAKAKGLLTVIISIDKQQLTLYSDGVPIAHSRVSTGTGGHPTPTGVFSVIQKDRWHRSNLYGNAPMFYMQRITWSGVAMHQGIVPNYPASHGCIRLPEAFAKQMWGITKLGMRVIIARSEVTPAAVASAKLFTIKREAPEPKIEAKLESKFEGGATSADVVKGAYGALEFAGLAGAKRESIVSDAFKPGDPAYDAMAFAMAKPREVAASDAKSPYDVFDKRRAKTAATDGAGATDVRPLKPGPVSVFISRKEGKLFVRKGFEPLFNVPVTFEQPDKPLGTHVFTALAVKDDNTTMRWNVVSMPGAAAQVKKVEAKKPEKGAKVEPIILSASNAAEALDRVTIPQDAIDRISELMSPGASLIISDQGLGSETGVGTDFIVQTR